MTKAYNNPVYTTFTYEQHDFGAGGDTKEIVGPNGFRGQIVDILLSDVTEGFTNNTAEGAIQAGVSGAADKFANFGLGTTAAGTGDAASRNTGDLKGGVLADDETLLVTFVAPNGGTPAGIADVQVIVAWHS